MLVSELIQILEKLPAHRQVLIDISPSQADYWVFSEVGDADEVRVDEKDEPVVLISRHKLSELPSEADLSHLN